MRFEFRCPQGHLLLGESSHIGQPCQCPICGTSFMTPVPIATIESPPFVPPPPPSPLPTIADRPPAAAIGGANLAIEPLEPDPQSPFNPFAGVSGPRLLSILCPNGHPLETPEEMLNQEAICPHCGTQFLLREVDSLEYQRRQQERIEVDERRIGNFWLTWAAVALGLVVFGLGLLVLLSQ
ncbi:MAG: hypothetical protein R3E01_11815 [Pirellulaceae bacterium]|nr:hypothetical protein [Planctomycetales bacterium]